MNERHLRQRDWLSSIGMLGIDQKNRIPLNLRAATVTVFASTPPAHRFAVSPAVKGRPAEPR